MSELVTAPLSSKAQLTLPKSVRKLLGIHKKGELVGFLIDPETQHFQLSIIEAVPVHLDYTPDEYQVLLGLTKEKGGKLHPSMDALIKELKQP